MQRLKEILKKFPGKKITVIGDVMLDRFVYGDICRINPEDSAAPILDIKTESIFPGGAANTASNLASLGGDVSLFGFIGKDPAGEQLQELLKARGVNFYPSYSKLTTEKIRFMTGQRQTLRADREERSSKNLNSPEFDEVVSKSEVVVVSDYAKGTIGREIIERLKHAGKRIIVDPKPQNVGLYKGVCVVKLNESEALKISGMEEVLSAGDRLKQVFNSKIIVTRGAKGAVIFGDSVREIPTEAKEVYDITGAGDSFIAALSLAIASGADFEEAAIIANHAAGIAVEKTGTTAVTLSELEQRIFGEESKIVDREQLREIIEKYKSRSERVVWTNGCFDLLHEGHVRYLKSAKKLGDYLVVGINSDESVRRLKGEGRPIRGQDARAEILASLACVDHVMIFSELNTSPLIAYIKPDLYVKGGNYNIDTINQEERGVLEKGGIKIEFIPVEVDISTTKILESTKTK